MRVTLIIPALNEADCLPSLLAEVPVHLLHQLIVVDNGSTDQTAEVARKAGARVVSEPRRGYGFACAAGAAAAEGEVLAFMDGDGSFVPGELPALLAPLARGEADLVLGSRLRNPQQGTALPPHQLLGNELFVGMLRFRYRVALTDLGPFRVIRREVLHALDMQEFTYGWPLEMIVKTLRRRLRIVELPITFRPRFAGKSKVGGSLRASLLTAYRFSRVALRY